MYIDGLRKERTLPQQKSHSHLAKAMEWDYKNIVISFFPVTALLKVKIKPGKKGECGNSNGLEGSRAGFGSWFHD